MPRQTLRAAVRHGVNAPLSSSTGRLFVAVAACLGTVPALQTYEGEAALRLEALAGPQGGGYPFGPALDPAPMFRALAQDLMEGTSPATIAARFHDGLAAAFAAPARAAVQSGRAKAVALSGGCFQNPRLMAATLFCLTDVPVLIHRHVPPMMAALPSVRPSWRWGKGRMGNTAHLAAWPQPWPQDIPTRSARTRAPRDAGPRRGTAPCSAADVAACRMPE